MNISSCHLFTLPPTILSTVQTVNHNHQNQSVFKMEKTKKQYPCNQQYPCIGRGFCGTVWAVENNRALKREDGGPGRSVGNDYYMHCRLLNAVSFSSSVHTKPEQRAFPAAIPQVNTNMDGPCQKGFAEILTQVFKLIEPWDTEFWRNSTPQFPKDYEPCLSLLSERIPHFPREVREQLIKQFCPPTLKDFIRSNPSDEHCLVRLYLGRRRVKPKNESRFQRFSLRNYPLHIDQMEDLDLDIEAYARAMGIALALIHWVAGIDGNDVEFVLAPPRVRHDHQNQSPVTHLDSPYMNSYMNIWSSSTKSLPESEVFHSHSLGEHTIWILDFDCCHPISFDEDGVEQAVTAFFRNDPYFPRPCTESSDYRSVIAWRIFREAFLKRSLPALGDERYWLAERLMKRIEEVYWERKILSEEARAGGDEQGIGGQQI